jgi:DNA-binding transcriptional ArsR family regulator
MVDDNHTDYSKLKSDKSIKIISVDDEKIKTVGEILANDSSRAILKILAGKETSANQIAQDTNLSIALVSFHLKKMQNAELVKITRTGKSVKGQDVKYYSATNQSVLITPAKQAESVLQSMKRYSRFAAIGLAGFVSWIVMRKETDAEWTSGEEISTGSESIAEQEVIQSSNFVSIEDALENYPVPSTEPTHSGVQDLYVQLESDAAGNLDSSAYDTL